MLGTKFVVISMVSTSRMIPLTFLFSASRFHLSLLTFSSTLSIEKKLPQTSESSAVIPFAKIGSRFGERKFMHLAEFLQQWYAQVLHLQTE